MPTSLERRRHPFLRRLQRALVEDARADVTLALRGHVLAARGCTNAQIAERLGASITHVNVAADRLRRIRLLDQGEQ
jgi:hypothetical protein